MVTENYINGFFHFYNSFRRFNNNKIVCYVINTKEPEYEFKDVIFKRYNGSFDKETSINPDGVLKVTYLKSYFLDQVSKEYKDNVLWLDSSKLVMGDLSWVERYLKDYDCVTFGRPNKKSDKRYFAALIGFRSNSPELSRYVKLCEADKNNWFSDQRSLNGISNIYELDYDKYVSAENNKYDDSCLFVRNLPKDRKNKFEASEEYFVSILKKYISNYDGLYQRFKDMEKEKDKDRLNICFLMHHPKEDWCFLRSYDIATKYGKHNYSMLERLKDRKYIEKLNPDLVWSRGGIFLIKDLFKWNKGLKRKVVHTVTHGGENLWYKLDKCVSLSTGSKALLVQNNDALIRARYELKKKGFDVPVYLLPNGVDIEHFTPKPKPDEFVVGFVGRNNDKYSQDQKGIRLFKLVANVMGLTVKYATNEKDNKFSFNKMPEFYNSVSCIVLPSHSEGHSNAINEAQACGLPVISTKVGYHGEYGTNYKDIIFCGRSAYSLIKHISYLRDNPKERKRIGDNARKFAEGLDAREVIKQYEELFEELVS